MNLCIFTCICCTSIPLGEGREGFPLSNLSPPDFIYSTAWSACSVILYKFEKLDNADCICEIPT